MKIKKNSNKRPQSCRMKNLTINKNLNRNIPINGLRTFSSNNTQKNNLEEMKTRLPKAPYLDKYKSQLTKIDMYKELWDKSLSDYDEHFGLGQTIQINSENFKNNFLGDKFRANATSTRKNSAVTYNDINYISKRTFKNMKNKDINEFWKINSEDSNYMKYHNNKIRTNTFIDLYLDKESKINLSNYNTTIQTINKNNINTDLSLIKNFETNLSNHSNKNQYFNYGVPKRKKEKEIIIIDETKKVDEIEDKNNFEKLVRENNNTTLNLRTEYLIKLSKLLSVAKKFIYSMEYFRIEKRDIYSLYMKNLTTAFDICNDFFVNQIKEGDVLNHDSWSKLLLQYYNLSYHLIRFQKNAFNEMHYLKNENMILKQKLYGLEGELNNKKKDINDLNKYIVHYDLTNKVKYKKKREMSIKEIKQKYNSQESDYILTIHQLRHEIKQLTDVLNQNKFDINNFNEINDKFKKLKEEAEENKNEYENKDMQKEMMLKVLTQNNIDLNEKINEIEEELEKYKKKEEDTKLKFIEYESKIKTLNEIIENKNNLIEQLKEEKKMLIEKKSDEDKSLPKPVETVFLSPKDKLRKHYKKEKKS